MSCVLALAGCGGGEPPLGTTELFLTVRDCPRGSHIIQGTSGNDLLNGTTGADCILGNGGDDRILGNGGADVLIGGPGNDRLEGGAGDDALYGEAGEDLLLGGAGNDRLFGGTSSDVLDGQGGTDTADANGGNDVVLRTTETVDGNAGFDLCAGTRCESSSVRSCTQDANCAPDGRCLFSTACVSCQGDPTCRGTLNVGVGVSEQCATGFQLDAQGTCADLDECTLSTDDCDAQATCTNLPGTFDCACAGTHYGSGHGANGCTARAVELSAGASHTCALLAGGRVKCWGRNQRGQLGLGNTQARGDGPNEMGDALPAVSLGASAAVELVSGDAFNCVLREDGSLVCFGDNRQGQLGIGSVAGIGDRANEMGAALVAVNLGGHTVAALSAGAAHVCATLDDGTLRCWGENAAGQLGLGDTLARGDQAGETAALPPLDLGAGAVGAVPLAGAQASCAIFGSGTVKCWGDGVNGLAGQGDTLDRGDGPGEMGAALLAVPVGTSSVPLASYLGDHACVLFGGGTVRCWGNNDRGQLGLGNTATRGDGPGEMGASLPAVSLGGAVAALFGTPGGACVRLASGAVKCWGRNDRGALGLGDSNHRGDAPGEMGDALPAVSLGTGLVPVQIVGGTDHRCALFDGGQVKCWGGGNFGQLGRGNTADIGDQPNEMGDTLPFVALGH